MKNLILTITALVFISLINLLNAQAPNWAWAKSAGGAGEDIGYSVATDANGNVFMAGNFQSPTITFGTTTLTNIDNTGNTKDLFIVKYDANGNVLWAKSAGESKDDYGKSLATDANGNVFMTGWFNSDSITFGTTTLINTGINDDIFIVKYDASGNVLWAKSSGGVNSDIGYCVATDASGNVLMTGRFGSSTITFGTTTLTNTGSYDIFLMKYDANGNVLWAKNANGVSSDGSFSVATDGLGNVFITGWFYSSLITFDNLTLSNAGNFDIFIVKYDGVGNAVWAKSAGSFYEDKGLSISTDANGNAFITGYFEGPNITFGTTSITNTNPNGNEEIFIVKYDSSGNLLWAKSEGSADSDKGYNIAIDAIGNVFLSGLYHGYTITFGTTTLSNIGPFNYDIFIVKFDTVGNLLWAKSAGGIYNDEGYSISIDASGSLFLTGYFQGTSVNFETTILKNSNVLGFFSDIFIAKLDTAMLTGLEITENKNGISIYPNPASDQLTISNGQWAKGNAVTISISDITGKLIYTTTATTSKTEINTKDFSKGVYLVKLQTKDFVETCKVIKN